MGQEAEATMQEQAKNLSIVEESLETTQPVKLSIQDWKFENEEKLSEVLKQKGIDKSIDILSLSGDIKNWKNLSYFTRIGMIDLHNLNSLTIEDLEDIRKFGKNTNIESVDLSYLMIGDEHLKHIPSTVKELLLEGTGISSQGLKYLNNYLSETLVMFPATYASKELTKKYRQLVTQTIINQ
jgi:hypothetical protein